MRRVAVTGLGAVTPIGLDAPSTWRAIAGEVKGFDAASVAPPKEARRMDRNVLLAVAAAQEAWLDAGLDGGVDPARAGIVVGSAIGGRPGIGEQQ
jgi:3-oxoacyl-[acyl-carrier-protein] synthase II